MLTFGYLAVAVRRWLVAILVLLHLGQAMEFSGAQSKIPFRQHVLNADSEFSAATAFDVNGDGRLDIISGAFWYAAPDWSKHHFRDVEMIRGRFDDYSNLPLDVDEDGDLDIVSVNYRSQSLYWCRNPGQEASNQIWEKIVIDTPGTSETGRLADINGDGRLDVLPSGTSFAAWYEITGKDRTEGNAAEVKWKRHDLPDELIGHGIGVGDINGDGRIDIVCPRGWAEAPEDVESGRWRFHPDFELARDCGLPILCYDVDRDGDTDLVWARGHDIGIYWTENLGPNGSSLTGLDAPPMTEELRAKLEQVQWETHAIDTTCSSIHTLMLADIDGDGSHDLVAGKRFMGHDGKDPGENDPLGVRWFSFDLSSKTWQPHLLTQGGKCGIDLDSTCVDIDGDGDMDILAPSRSGLHWLENLSLGAATDSTKLSPANEDFQPVLASTPKYASHRDFTYLLTDSGRQPLENALDHGVRRQQILRQMEQVMGELPSSRQRVALDVRIESVTDAGSYARVKLTYAAEPEDRVPAYLLIPYASPRPLPGMLCLHPTHFELGKAQICGLGGKPSRFYAHELAEQGYVCLAPDYPGFGDYPYDFASQGRQYASGTMKAIWNHIRAVDLLETLPCVDRDQIGVIGHSLGGHNALFVAAFDQRIRCVVTSCGFNAFEDYRGGDLTGWTSSRYMPRIREQYGLDPAKVPFDFPEVLAAIAPRPIFVNAPLQDDNFAVVGVRKCQTSLEPLLKLLDKHRATTFVYPDAEHDFPEAIRRQVYQWLDDNLR